MIADEMGLGKTVQAITTALCYRDEWPLLVLCPASLCANWRTELVKWMQLAGLEDAGEYVCHGTPPSHPMGPHPPTPWDPCHLIPAL